MLCPNCFGEKEENIICPECGFDESERRSPLLLPYRTLLHGQYLVGRVLGKPGGFGITYLGWDIPLGSKVAIKEYLPRDIVGRSTDASSVMVHTDDDTESFEYGLEQFLRESRTLAKFDHPNVVRIRNFFAENGTAYLVMDYYEGVSLSEYVSLQGGKVAEATAVSIMMMIMDGLREIHAQGFLHRDVKPQNIYLTDKGRPILLDFGAARAAMTQRSVSIVMTPGFAPPEQYHRKGEQGPWTDIYACAATLYYVVTGVSPQDATERLMADELAAVENLASVTPQFALAINQALAINHHQRPQTIAEFQSLFVRAATQPPPVPSSVIPQVVASQTPNSSAKFESAASSEKPMAVEPERSNAQQPAKSTKNWFAIIAGIILFLGVGISGLYALQLADEPKVVTLADGSRYEGQLKNNIINGQGKLTFPDGRQYQGGFKNGVILGEGTMRYLDGSRYEGHFVGGKRDGQGKYYNTKGIIIYEGQWQQDVKSGIGKMTYSNGAHYEGQFLKDKRHGQGKVFFANNTQYTGQFVANSMEGIGVTLFANGDRYEGEYRSSNANGFGIYYWTNGDRYEGDWQHNKMHGRGIIIRSNGSRLTGYWVNGKFSHR